MDETGRPSIIHVGSIAGVPQELSKAQRRLGLKSDVITFQNHPFKYDVDISRPTRLPVPLKYLERIQYFFKVVKNYDVLHFHWSSLIPFGWDIPLWRRKEKCIIVHHHGDDIRRKGEGWFYKKFADQILVSTPDLLDWSPDAVWVPNPIDLQRYQYLDSEKHTGNTKILHAPSDRGIKGTKYVIKAVEDLREEGYDVELVLVENMSHEKAVECYKSSDIVVDQLLAGWYGVFAIECMAMGKPVCVYIKEELESYLHSNPLVNTSPARLKEDLRILLEDEKLRSKIGREARRFVEVTHDSNKISRYLIDNIYIK